MIGAAAPRRIPVELTSGGRFERRVKRLAVVSAVALGLVWVLVVRTLDAPPALGAAFAAGWLLMPSTLLGSLTRPRLRYGLVVPASLISAGLLAVCIGWLPAVPSIALGWVLMTAGVALGGMLGLWLWYRLLPVPATLDDPFSPARWTLIAIHVGLIVAGFAFAAQGL